MIQMLPGEKLILERRRHWLPLAAEAAPFLATILLPLVLLLLGAIVPDIMLVIREYAVLLVFLGATWLLCAWVVFFVMLTNYYLDVLFVTTHRVIDVEQIGLFSRDVAEMKLENIQDIKTEVLGVLPSLFKYGDLRIQTAAVKAEFVVRNLPRPDEIKNIIFEHYHAASRQE